METVKKLFAGKNDENKLSKISAANKKAIWSTVALVLLFGFFAITQFDKFITATNLINLTQQIVTYAIIGYGLTFVLVGGGTDLSAGASLALAGIIALSLMSLGMPLWLAIIASLIFGILMGVLNGFSIEVLGVVPFIATLGTQWVFRGLSNILVEGKPIYTKVIASDAQREFFYSIGAGRLWPNGLPYSVVITAVYGLILYILLSKTRIGRQIYACGSNLEAAKLSGINTVRTRMFAYCVSGFSAALCGIIVTSRVSSAQPLAGQGYELEAIAASVVGGVSNSGGEGTILNTIIGALIMGVLRNGLNISRVNTYYQQVIIGIILVGTVALDVYRHKKQ